MFSCWWISDIPFTVTALLSPDHHTWNPFLSLFSLSVLIHLSEQALFSYWVLIMLPFSGFSVPRKELGSQSLILPQAFVRVSLPAFLCPSTFFPDSFFLWSVPLSSISGSCRLLLLPPSLVPAPSLQLHKWDLGSILLAEWDWIASTDSEAVECLDLKTVIPMCVCVCECVECECVCESVCV